MSSNPVNDNLTNGNQTNVKETNDYQTNKDQTNRAIVEGHKENKNEFKNSHSKNDELKDNHSKIDEVKISNSRAKLKMQKAMMCANIKFMVKAGYSVEHVKKDFKKVYGNQWLSDETIGKLSSESCAYSKTSKQNL